MGDRWSTGGGKCSAASAVHYAYANENESGKFSITSLFLVYKLFIVFLTSSEMMQVHPIRIFSFLVLFFCIARTCKGRLSEDQNGRLRISAVPGQQKHFRYGQKRCCSAPPKSEK